MKKIKLFIPFAAVMICLLFAGCGSANVAPQVFSDNGISITMTNEFKLSKNENYSIYVSSNSAAFGAFSETKAELAAAGLNISSLEHYTNIVKENNNVTAATYNYSDENITFNYFFLELTIKDREYSSINITLETDDAYICGRFMCYKVYFEEMKDQFLDYAKTIKIEK